MVPNSPFPEEEFYEKWHGWVKKYNVVPVCHDMYINSTLYKNRVWTQKECVQALINEIKFADRMGIRMIRMNSLTPTNIIQPCLPYAEKYNVVMAQEIHAGYGLDHPYMVRYTDIMQKENSPYIGLVPDMGLFCKKFPRVIINYYLNAGVSKQVADHVEYIFNSGKDMRNYISEIPDGINQIIPPEFKKFDLSDIDLEFIKYVSHFENNNTAILHDIMPYIKNIHAKFYEMNEDGEEYSIPYEEIINILKNEGYNGYMCSEYEGNRFVPDGQEVEGVKQVGLHQQMMKKYIGM
jgi:hypothetical protein